MSFTDGRKKVFTALVGSHNYNMNTPESDKDYKMFVLPTFDDLYSGTNYSKTCTGLYEDYDIHDIRQVNHLWWKANINFLEVLFSKEIIFNWELKEESMNYLKQIFDMKNEIARMNLPYLYDACIGMHKTKKNLINKGTEGTKHLVEKYGYDTKQAMHSIRVLHFLVRFTSNNFSDFEDAIWYPSEHPARDLLIGIKNGSYSKDIFETICMEYLLEAELVAPIYKQMPKEEKTNLKLANLVKEIVKTELF